MNRSVKPPRLPEKILEWYCDHAAIEDLCGDMEEVFYSNLENMSLRKARLKYWREAARLMVSYAVRKRKRKSLNNRHSHSLKNTAMLKSYFKIGIRNLLRNKGYSIINVGGLMFGMAVTILIGLWVYDELSFNKNFEKYDRIVQLRSVRTDPTSGVGQGSESFPIPMVNAIRTNYPNYFDKVVLSFWDAEFIVSSENKKIPRKGKFMEGGVLDMLSLDMVKGSYTSLNDPHSIVISESTADALFGKEDPINKSLKLDNRIDVTVTGVFKDTPLNSRFGEQQFFCPWELWVMSNNWVRDAQDNWGNFSFTAYAELKPGVSLSEAQAGIMNFYTDYTPQDWKKDVTKYKPSLLLYPMSQWHLYSEFENGMPTGGRITFVWLFSIVGLFVLVLACINFMNLSTARSEKRAKEVGVRKAIGSVRSQLIYQFISESFLVVLLAFLLALLVVSGSLSLFNELSEKQLQLPFLNPVFWLISLAFIFLTGLLASLYPAFFLSSFSPAKVLKGTLRLGRFGTAPRKVLVVVQFTVSVVLTIGTIVVYQQIQYAHNRPIGYNSDGVLTVNRNDPSFTGKFDALRTELIKTGAVSGMELSSSPLTAVWNNVGGFTWTGKDPESDSDFSVTNVSFGFGELVGWQFVNGRDFSEKFPADTTNIVINETAAKYLNLTNPVGEVLRDGDRAFQIIGVIKDMVMTSPFEPEKRAIFFLDKRYSSSSQIHIRIKPTVSAVEALPRIENVFKAIVPAATFDYRFVSDDYGRKFSSEERIGKLATLFAILAISISCLGLFGLASFMAEQRAKEFSIRKVMGASVFSLWTTLSKDFVILVITAAFIALPIAWYFMTSWLANYKYRIGIEWWIFAIAASGAIIITLVTVSFHAIKAALANPAKNLRSE